jgi:tetratricopeptide (TPR) repeat protein
MSLPLMAEGEFALVRHHLELAFKMAAIAPIGSGAEVNEYDLCVMLADLAVRQRDTLALRQYAPLAEAMAQRIDHTLYQAIAQRAWGVAHRLAGEYDAAEVRLKRALELFEGLETRWQIGRTCFELGELALAQTDTAAVRGHLSRALATFEALRAAPDAARTHAVLESLA